MPSAKRPDLDPGAKLRELLSGKKTIATPGVFNPAVALLAEEAGFECLYFSGAAFANSMGLPDLGVTTLSEVAEAAGRITAAVPSLPLIVDVDTGFGEAVNVARTVREMEKAGRSRYPDRGPGHAQALRAPRRKGGGRAGGDGEEGHRG